jgi:hypothetical protein
VLKVLAFVGLAAASGFVAANDDHLIKARYDEQVAAANSLNAKRFLATFDKSFTEVGSNGRVVRYPEYSATMEGTFNQVKSAKFNLKVGSIKYAHGTAVANYSLQGDFWGRNGNRLHIVEKGRDTWKKIGGTYKLMYEVVISSTATPMSK